MSWVAAAVVGGAVISGVASNRAAKKSAKGPKNAVREQRRQYDQTREDFAPWREAGTNALARLQDPDAFEQSPGYEFIRSEGTRDIGNTFAAKGSGGNALRALAQFNSGLASRDYNDWWNRQSSLAGLGQSATSSTSAAGSNAANQIGMYQQNAANARASGVQGVGNAINSGLGNYLYFRGMNNSVSEIPASDYAPTQRTYYPGG